jgi:hypothetical protein
LVLGVAPVRLASATGTRAVVCGGGSAAIATPADPQSSAITTSRNGKQVRLIPLFPPALTPGGVGCTDRSST